MKKDDATIPAADLQNIRKSADLLLRRADAYGRFPTPVKDIVAAAKLEISRESALDKVFLGGLYRRLPNAVKLAPDSLKRAVGKVLGILDRADRTIHLDPAVHPKKRIFLSLHETAHDALVWQRKTYALLEDSENELDPDTKEQFEREANCFASEALFQLDTFTAEAAESEFGIRTPLDLSSRYGASFYATARRYIGTSKLPCALLVFNQPIHIAGVGETLNLRRAFASSSFQARYGSVAWPTECGPEHFLNRIRPGNKFTSPRPCTIRCSEGERVQCLAEAFDSTHQIFFLVYPQNVSAFRVAV
jgi:hypothetical protein